MLKASRMANPKILENSQLKMNLWLVALYRDLEQLAAHALVDRL